MNPGDVETLPCGCVLACRESHDGSVVLVFMTPCSADHKRIAETTRKPGSNLVVKSVAGATTVRPRPEFL